MERYLALKLWVKTGMYGVAFCILAGVYLYLQIDTFNLFQFNKTLIFSGVVLINFSFALSGLTYFWNIGITKLGYRKQLGVVGLTFALAHAIVSTYLFAPSLLSFSLYKSEPLTFIPASLALIVFIIMVIMSNFGIPQKIGAYRWRQVLRAGYAGVVLFTIHIAFVSFDNWQAWIGLFDPILPPLSLLLFSFSLFVLSLRIALFFSLKKKRS